MRKVVIGAVALLLAGMLDWECRSCAPNGLLSHIWNVVLRNGLLGYGSWASASEMLQTIW
jgi:hypothetical protein